MDREVFFDWLDAMVLSDDSRALGWQVAQDDGDGCITVKFHNVEEEEEETNG